MRKLSGKAFQNIETREIQCFLYDPQQNYYDMVQDAAQRGYQQNIFTSSVMISLIEHFLLNHHAFVAKVEFLVEDLELTQEINLLLEKLKGNGAYWEVLKEKLSFLSRCDSIDIKKVDITARDSMGFLLTLQVNGIFTVSEDAYDSVSDEIGRIVRRVIT